MRPLVVRVAPEIVLTDEERDELTRLVRSKLCLTSE
jgi:hypothetical protein